MSSKYRVKVYRNEWRSCEEARLEISVGQDYHEGEKLAALTEWVSRHFKAASVNLCDTLQRYNHQFNGFGGSEALKAALHEGDLWLQRNASIISRLPNLKITRWEDWKKDTDWLTALETTLELKRIDRDFAKIIEDQIEEFWQRKTKKQCLDKSLKEEFSRSSRLYILEEIAVTMVMSRNKVADIYPGSFLGAFDYLRKKRLPAPHSMTTVGFGKREKTPEFA
jgi:tRNA-dependent cyclodipeptide synthase